MRQWFAPIPVPLRYRRSRKSPTHLNGGCELALLLEDGADGSGISLGAEIMAGAWGQALLSTSRARVAAVKVSTDC
jgi:hypothetical protein